MEHNYNLKDKLKVRKWLKDSILMEDKTLGDLNFIFCSDEYLLKVNRESLDHDYYTDIITFDLCEASEINGDLFISIERVEENAKDMHLSFIDELHRVMIHGVLHLCGYKDKSNDEAKLMRSKEDFYLKRRISHLI